MDNFGFIQVITQPYVKQVKQEEMEKGDVESILICKKWVYLKLLFDEYKIPPLPSLKIDSGLKMGEGERGNGIINNK